MSDVKYHRNLTAKYATGNNPGIKGREKIIRNIFLTLLRHEKPNAILVGPPGVGKTSIIMQLAYYMATAACPPFLADFRLVEVFTNALLAGPGYRGTTEKKFEDLIKASLGEHKTVLFVDEIHTIEGLGQMSNGQTPGLSNTLKPYLTRGDFRMIGATTYKEYNEMKDKAFLRRFATIHVGELPNPMILGIIKMCFRKFIGEHKIKVNSDVPARVMQLSKTIEGQNPDKAKDIVDLTVAAARLDQAKVITIEYVESIFNEFFIKLKQDKPKVKEEGDIFADNLTEDAKATTDLS